MNDQFVIPKHPAEPVDPFSKKDFMDKKRNLLLEQQALGRHHKLELSLSGNLLSNLGTFEAAQSYKKPHTIISKEFTFAAAHALPFHKGKCRFLHGHEWKLKVSISGPINSTGMIMDFSDLKNIVEKTIIDQMDHAYINALLFNPTAENLCVYIWNKLQYEGELKGISKITLWETPTSHAILTAKEMSNRVLNMWDWNVQDEMQFGNKEIQNENS